MTATVYVDGPPVTMTLGVAAPNALPDTLRSWARTPVFEGGSYVTGAAPWSSVNATVKSTVAPGPPVEVAGAVTVGLGADGGAPPAGVAQSSFTSTLRLPPPDPDPGYSKVTERLVILVQFSPPSFVHCSFSQPKSVNGNAALKA